VGAQIGRSSSTSRGASSSNRNRETKDQIAKAVVEALGQDDASVVLKMLFGNRSTDSDRGSSHDEDANNVTQLRQQLPQQLTPAVCQRLYQQASVWQERRQQRVQLKDTLEREARKFHAQKGPNKDVSPRVYDWYLGNAAGKQPAKKAVLPTGMGCIALAGEHIASAGG
jgi:hypothetical protein